MDRNDPTVAIDSADQLNQGNSSGFSARSSLVFATFLCFPLLLSYPLLDVVLSCFLIF